MKPELDLSIVIVNYNTKELLSRCLESIALETSDIEYEVIVVDNDSGDGSPGMLKDHFPAVRLIENKENAGFAQANNSAIAQAGGRYTLLLNPDTVVLSNALAKLVKFMDSHPEAGLAGCRLLSADGSLQFSARNFPTVANKLFEALFLHRLFPSLSVYFGEVVFDSRFYDSARKVGWVSGAVMIVRKEVLSAVGLLDGDYFLYAEEMDWCYRIRQAGYQVYFDPGAEIIHLAGEFKANPKLFAEDMHSRTLFYQKHYAPHRVFGFRLVTNLYLAVRVVAYFAAREILRDQRADRRLRAYVQGLRELRRRTRATGH